MNHFTTFLLSLLCLFSPSLLDAQDKVIIHIPSPEEEATYIWGVIRDITFFEQYNYQLSLPDDPLIETLKKRSKANQLQDADYEKLKQLIQEKVYNPADYRRAQQAISARIPLLNKMIAELQNKKRKWSFKSFPQYTVRLTLYGSGGSYHPDDGSIILYCTPEGGFKNYKDPANTIMHEVTHIGIEESIIQTLQVPHPAKERLVDLIVQRYFAEQLPNYRLQGFGDARLNPYLLKEKNYKNLLDVMRTFLAENQYQSNN